MINVGDIYLHFSVLENRYTFVYKILEKQDSQIYKVLRYGYKRLNTHVVHIKCTKKDIKLGNLANVLYFNNSINN